MFKPLLFLSTLASALAEESPNMQHLQLADQVQPVLASNDDGSPLLQTRFKSSDPSMKSTFLFPQKNLVSAPLGAYKNSILTPQRNAALTSPYYDPKWNSPYASPYDAKWNSISPYDAKLNSPLVGKWNSPYVSPYDAKWNSPYASPYGPKWNSLQAYPYQQSKWDSPLSNGQWNAHLDAQWNSPWNARAASSWNAAQPGQWSSTWNSRGAPLWNAGQPGQWSSTWNSKGSTLWDAAQTGQWNSSLAGPWSSPIASRWNSGLYGDQLASQWKSPLSVQPYLGKSQFYSGLNDGTYKSGIYQQPFVHAQGRALRLTDAVQGMPQSHFFNKETTSVKV